MLFTFELPFSLAFTYGYFPDKYRVICFIAVILFSALVSFVGFAVPELYSRWKHYPKPEYDPCVDTLEYIKKKRLWMSRIAGVIFAVCGFLLSYFIKDWYITIAKEGHSTEALNMVGYSYELRMVIWSYLVIYLEGMFWFIPEELFMPDEPSWVYFVLPAVVLILIPMLYFALNIKICAIILGCYYILLYIRGLRRNHRNPQKTDEEEKIENNRSEKYR